MKLALLLVLATACQSDGGDDYPLGPGGGVIPGSSSGGGRRDAGVSDGAPGDGPPQIRGRVCVLKDLRAVGDVMACDPMKGKGINVTFGSARTTTTGDDGSFSIDARMESNLVWRADGGNSTLFVPSVFPSGNGATIPMLTVDTYNELLGNNSVVLQEGQGSVVVQVRLGAMRAAGVTATLPVAVDAQPRYDGASLVDWDARATGDGGIVWVPGVPLGLQSPPTTRISFSLNGISTNQFVDAPIEDGAITFVVKNLQ